MSTSELIRARAQHLAGVAGRGSGRIEALAKLAAELFAEADELDGIPRRRRPQARPVLLPLERRITGAR